jgi:hypothetical protein
MTIIERTCGISGFAGALLLVFLAACGGGGTKGDAADGEVDAVPDTGEEGADVPDLAPDRDADSQDGDGVDLPPDTEPDGEDADAPPECIFDDTVEHDAYCRLMQMDVAREIPGGGDRTLYTFQIDYPGGDYDKRCLVMDEFTVTRGGEVIRAAAASFDPAVDRFFMDDEATPGELEACGGEGRVNLFAVSYSGRSPAGKFSGGCDTSHWTPQTTLACHSGVEASFSIFNLTIYVDSSMTAPYIDFDGSFGNHGSSALATFTMDALTWHNLDNPSETLALTGPLWVNSGFWNDDPAWEDRVEPDTRQPVTFNVGATEAVATGGLCTMGDVPLSAAPTNIVLSGSHSAGAFTVETHPLYCLIMTTP